MVILYPVLVLAGLGAVCAILLILASKFMSVPPNEKFAKIRECLPGANCGACGYAGCDGYANALSNGEESRTNKCLPGADATAKAIAEIMGSEFEDVIEHVAVVRCRGDCLSSKNKMDYEGITTCAGAKLVFGGRKNCIYGCIGFGDCAKACPHNAITIIDGLARINWGKCVGCGICVKTCPSSVIELIPDVNRVFVECGNHNAPAATRKICNKGCIGCRMCERNCAQGAVTVKDNLAVIDYEKCVFCGKCAEVCTTKCIKIEDISSAHRK